MLVFDELCSDGFDMKNREDSGEAVSGDSTPIAAHEALAAIDATLAADDKIERRRT